MKSLSALVMTSMAKLSTQNQSSLKQPVVTDDETIFEPFNIGLINVSFDAVADDTDPFDGYHSIKAIGYSRSNSLFIIVSACVIGGVVILINIVVITYIIRKRRTRGGRAAVISSSKSQHVPLEKTYRGGPKYTGPYCGDPQHRHMYGEHLYVPDPLLMGEAAQSNPVYGCVPVGDSLSDVRNGVCQSTYLPALYTGDPNYQQVHHTLSGGFQSPLTPVVSLIHLQKKSSFQVSCLCSQAC